MLVVVWLSAVPLEVEFRCQEFIRQREFRFRTSLEHVADDRKNVAELQLSRRFEAKTKRSTDGNGCACSHYMPMVSLLALRHYNLILIFCSHVITRKRNAARDFHIYEINTHRVAVSVHVRISDPIIHMRQHSPIYSSSFPAVRVCRTGKLQQFDESGNRMGGGCPFMSKEQGMDFQVRPRTVW